MNVFMVIEAGVYRHRIVGVFTTLKAAKAAGLAAIEAEADHYHDMDMVRVELDGEPFAETDVGYWTWERDSIPPTLRGARSSEEIKAASTAYKAWGASGAAVWKDGRRNE